MAASVIVTDLIGESEYIEDDSGRSDIRRFLISGLTPGSGIRMQASSTPGVPQYGVSHPNNASLYATRRSFKPFLNSQTEVKATIVYCPADDTNLIIPTVEFHGTTKDILTSLDINGAVIKVPYTSPAVAADPTNGITASPKTIQKTSIARVAETLAWGTLIVNRFETVVPKFALTFLNHVSNSTFQSQPARCWFMRDVSFKLQLTRPGYRVQYVIDYNEETFDDVAIWLDPITGYPPSDITVNPKVTVKSGNGWVRPTIKGSANFNALNLPKVF